MTNPLTREDVEELRAAVDAATEGHDSLGPVGMVIHITPAGKAKLTAALALASQSLSREVEPPLPAAPVTASLSASGQGHPSSDDFVKLSRKSVRLALSALRQGGVHTRMYVYGDAEREFVSALDNAPTSSAPADENGGVARTDLRE